MNSKELRIGNLVKYGSDILTIKNVHPKSVNLSINREHQVTNYIAAADIEPLNITSAIIKRLGFKDIYQRFSYPGLSGIYIDRVQNNFYLSADRTRITEIKAAHQLQNVFSDLYNITLAYH